MKECRGPLMMIQKYNFELTHLGMEKTKGGENQH